jgi:ferredoxin
MAPQSPTANDAQARELAQDDLQALAAIDRPDRVLVPLISAHSPRGAEVLAETLDPPVWNEVASRCPTCGNCTLVCPTCCCTTTGDATDLTDDHAERRRRRDSRFDFSYVTAVPCGPPPAAATAGGSPTSSAPGTTGSAAASAAAGASSGAPSAST